jgi:hypothetical protein
MRRGKEPEGTKSIARVHYRPAAVAASGTLAARRSRLVFRPLRDIPHRPKTKGHANGGASPDRRPGDDPSRTQATASRQIGGTSTAGAGIGRGHSAARSPGPCRRERGRRGPAPSRCRDQQAPYETPTEVGAPHEPSSKDAGPKMIPRCRPPRARPWRDPPRPDPSHLERRKPRQHPSYCALVQTPRASAPVRTAAPRAPGRALHAERMARPAIPPSHRHKIGCAKRDKGKGPLLRGFCMACAGVCITAGESVQAKRP